MNWMRFTCTDEAKTHLSRLVEQAPKGEPFVIAQAGKPLVKVTPLDTPVAEQVRRCPPERQFQQWAEWQK